MRAIRSGDVVGKRYEIEKLYRLGSLHEYWNAIDLTLGRPVIIKFMRSERIPEFKDIDFDEIFIRDASLLAQVEHPNILPIYDIGKHNDDAYVVTRDVQGLSLQDTIEENKWSTSSTIQFARRLSSALDYIHSLDIIHGDITHTNVIIGLQDQPYLANFTMAAWREELKKKVVKEIYPGTLGFLAPEIIKGEPATSLSDLYSFGALLFFCFTYHFPLKVTWLDFRPLPSIRHYKSELPIGIDIILKRLTQKNPEDRYQTATEAVDDLYSVFYSGQSNIDGKIFISYARKDSEYVHQLAKELRHIGLDIWIDQDIEPGSNWDEAIENGLNDCDMMLLITTEASMSSEYVTHEWSYFMGRGKPVYPFIPQSPIPDNIHPRLSRVQHVVGTDDMLNNVARIVDVLAGGTPAKLGGTENQGV